MDEEEKAAMLAGLGTRNHARRDEDEEDIVGSEISEFRNAAEVVSEMVAAEEGRSLISSRTSVRTGIPLPRLSMESTATSLPDYMSQVGGESLPTYEDETSSDGIADGLLYTPGSTAYSPPVGSVGSLDSVLGDVKE
jgi:hypothetical protein